MVLKKEKKNKINFTNSDAFAFSFPIDRLIRSYILLPKKIL
jgi:hypothetical protein